MNTLFTVAYIAVVVTLLSLAYGVVRLWWNALMYKTTVCMVVEYEHKFSKRISTVAYTLWAHSLSRARAKALAKFERTHKLHVLGVTFEDYL